MENNKTNGWKVLAIILLVVVILENSLIAYGYFSNKQIEKETNVCYYDLCEDYPNAYYNYESKLCDCYENDLMGNEVIAKQIYTGKR
jgi:hypothetical protein